MSSGIIGTLTPYVTSSFQNHSLTATTSIISSMVSGLIVLPYAKLLNVWGRPQSFALMIVLLTFGLILMAKCENVQTYCAAQVFYTVGSSAVSLNVTIFIADTTALKNRAFMMAFSSSPYLVTVWAFGPAAQAILENIGFRWGFGIWTIVIPVVSAPLYGLFYYNLRKARKLGFITTTKTDRTFAQSFNHYAKEFDLVGLLLIVVGLGLFLLSFSLYSYQEDQWKSPMILSFLIIGIVLIIAFGFWEKYGNAVTFIPWELLTNRTVIFTYTMVASIYFAWYLWNSFFYSYLIVVFNLSVSSATYMTNVYTIGSCFWALILGVIIRYNGRLKWLALYFGVPVSALGIGLMILFRQPDVNVGYVVMCLIFIAFGGGTLVICQQMTVMAVATHQYVSALLSMEYLIASVGGAVGSTVAGAIWTGVFPKNLAKYLPESAQGRLTEIYGSIVVQSSFPIGSPERIAINLAYSDTQRIMLIAATSAYAVAFISVMFWQDVDVRNMKKLKSSVF